jgi:hypothetical protein
MKILPSKVFCFCGSGMARRSIQRRLAAAILSRLEATSTKKKLSLVAWKHLPFRELPSKTALVS